MVRMDSKQFIRLTLFPLKFKACPVGFGVMSDAIRHRISYTHTEDMAADKKYGIS
jgi:hypothetical protein